MPKQKPSTIKLQVFKGREAKLNKTIFHILANKGPLTIYDMHREMKNHRGFRHTRYANVNRRTKVLEECGYVKKTGVRKTKAGFEASVYGLSAKAYLAMLLNSIEMSKLIMQIDESTAHTISMALLEGCV